MNYVVLFSGGYDSTYTLSNLSKVLSKVPLNVPEYFNTLRTKSIDDTITCISYYIDMTGPEKNKRENKARTDIIEYLQKRDGTTIIHKTIYSHSDESFKILASMERAPYLSKYNGLVQPILWYSQLILYVPAESVIIGSYISGDDALLHLDDISQIVTSSAKIMKKKVSVEFPLKNIHKADILSELMNDMTLFNMITSCESCESFDDNDGCGRCIPCHHLISALMDIETFASGERRSIASDILYKKFNIRSRLIEKKNEPSIEVDESLLVDECNNIDKCGDQIEYSGGYKNQVKLTIDTKAPEDVKK